MELIAPGWFIWHAAIGVVIGLGLPGADDGLRQHRLFTVPNPPRPRALVAFVREARLRSTFLAGR